MFSKLDGLTRFLAPLLPAPPVAVRLLAMYLVSVSREDPEAFLSTMAAPLAAARRGEPLPGVPFSWEAVANAFVMLGLLPEPRAEAILAEHRTALEAQGFRFGVLTGEMSVRPGAHGFQDAQEEARDSLSRIPLAVTAETVPIALDGLELSFTWATLIPAGVRLGFSVTGQLDSGLSGPSRQPYRVPLGQPIAAKIRAGVQVTDNLGQEYQMRPVRGRGTLPSGQPGQPPRWDGEMLAEPRAHAAGTDAGEPVRWLEFAPASGPATRVTLPAPAQVATGTAEPPWPTPAECYLAELAAVTSMSIGTDGRTVELDTARIVAAVADALLWVGALPPDSPLLAERTAAGGGTTGWREPLAHLWGREARQRALDGEPARAGLAVRLPLRHATAVIESVTAHENLVSIQLYGHPWVTGEYWPMITPCFQVRAIDDTGTEHYGLRGSGGGSPEGNWEFWFWPPVAPAAGRIRIIVSTLREAAWAEIDIPGRPA
jgi:hypothetical protein